MHFECGVGATEAEDNLGGGAFPRNCNAWTCPVCRPRRYWKLVCDIQSGHPNRFITITCRTGAFPTPELAAAAQSYAWKVVIQRWRRLKQSNKAEYFVVREATAEGWPHLHIAWRGPWIDQEWLSEQMAELLDSPIVSVEAIKNPQDCARYLAKYLGKAPHKFGNGNRYWKSRNYLPENRAKRQSVFPSRLRFRESNRTMYQVRLWLQNNFIEFKEHGGNALTWEYKPEPPRPKPKPEPTYWHFRSGIPHLKSKRGWVYEGR